MLSQHTNRLGKNVLTFTQEELQTDVLAKQMSAIAVAKFGNVGKNE